MKSFKKCTLKIHKQFSIERNRSYMIQLKNQNMILVFVILAKLSAALAAEDGGCAQVADANNTAFECNDESQGIDLSACVFDKTTLLSISSCANVTGNFDVETNGSVKFENIGMVDIHIGEMDRLHALEFINIDKILNIDYASFTNIVSLDLFRIKNTRIDKFEAVLNKTSIAQLEWRHVTIESLEGINISNGTELTISNCHFKNIIGPLHVHMFEKITIEHSIFMFSDFNDLSLIGNDISVDNNSIVNAAIKIKAKKVSVKYTCGPKSFMHIETHGPSSSHNFMSREITYDPPTKMYRDNNQLCNEQTCPCNYSNAGSIRSDVWYTLIFTVVFFSRHFLFGL